MILAQTTWPQGNDFPTPSIQRKHVEGDYPGVLADIYQSHVHLATWKRDLSTEIKKQVDDFLKANPNFQTLISVNADNALDDIKSVLGDKADEVWLRDMAELVEMFCCLFGLEAAGLRITATDKAMCPKFHVDRVLCRLVTTYQGVATQWLPHQVVNRSKLGRGSAGLSDSESGLYPFESDIQQVKPGDIALLKGELWEGNENAGVVHRSPAPPKGGSRLVLTLDFLS